MLNHNDFDEEKLRKLLSDMPRIQDEQDKSQLYDKISNQLNSDQHLVKKKQQKLPWLIPSIASVAVIVLLSVIFQDALPNNFNSSSDSGSEESMSSNDESAGIMEMAPFATEDSAKESRIQQGEESSGEQQFNASMADEDVLTNYVIYDTDPNVTLIPVAVMDNNIQYVVPLTLVDTSTGNVESDYFYNQLTNFINEEELGVLAYPFGDITFDFQIDQNQVVLNIPEDYQFGEGGAIGGMFEKILSAMFTPYDIDEAVLDPDDSREEPFGLYGNVDSIPLIKPTNQGFKLYEGNETTTLMVPASTSQFNSLEEAITDMKQSQPEFNLLATIPSDLELDVQVSDQVVTISSTSSTLTNSQETVSMIEAILLSAKSFGYKSVKFDFPIESVGSYQLQDAISVPDGANPIYLH